MNTRIWIYLEIYAAYKTQKKQKYKYDWTTGQVLIDTCSDVNKP